MVIQTAGSPLGNSVLYLVSFNRDMSLPPLEEVFNQGRKLWKDREVPEASPKIQAVATTLN